MTKPKTGVVGPAYFIGSGHNVVYGTQIIRVGNGFDFGGR